MAARTKILRGGIYNNTEFDKLEKFCKEHLRYKIGIPTTNEEAEKMAIDCYIWCQDRKKKNAPIITENDVFNFANDNGDIRESF